MFSSIHTFVIRNPVPITLLFFIFTVGMILMKGLFYIDDQISFPQFLGSGIINNLHIIDPNSTIYPVIVKINTENKWGLYVSFFQLDVFWPALLLMVNYYVAAHIFNQSRLIPGLLWFSFFALGMDYFENYTYVKLPMNLLPYLGIFTATKLILFYVCFAWMLLFGLRKVWQRWILGK
ncbi:MAG TPA: hypothetical protein PKC30_06025 [Saprospiraceae bacterium]|nr:hypothetical protein [Saprospiraceae bacterium]